MSLAFGHKLIVINDVRQPLTTLSPTPSGRPYMHLVTVKRGFKEYMAYADEQENLTWIEELDPKETFLLKRIEDDNEWNDLRDFLLEGGYLLTAKNDAELKLNKGLLKPV